MSDLIVCLNAFSPSWAEAMWRATWQGGLAIAGVWLLCLLLPKTPARVRCWWWRLALAKLFISLVWATPIPIAVLRANESHSPLGPTVSAAPISSQTELPTPILVPPLQNPGIHEASVPRVKLNIFTALVTIWSLGIIVGLLGIVRQRRSVRQLIRSAEPLGYDHPLQNECARLSRHFALRSTAEIRVAEDLSTPMLAGFRHPAILLPESFLQGKPPAQLRMMLAHELAHVKRRALGWAWLTIMARLLFFFHPFVWMARKEIALTEEMAADDLTLRLCQLRPADYAGMLVEVAGRLFSHSQEELVVGVAASHQTLKRRLQAMKHITPMSSRRLVAATVGLTTIGLGLIVPWRLTAQESSPWRTVTQRMPAGQGDPAGMTQTIPATPAKQPATVLIDASGNYHYADKVLPLNQLLSKLKEVSAADPKIALQVQADEKASYQVLINLLDGLKNTGIKMLSIATQPHLSSTPGIFDIAFGVWRPAESAQTGPAAAGREGDYWNSVGIPWNNDHTESDLKFASGEPSPIRARLVNLGGGWGNSDHMGVKSPMMNSYNYPANNQGGNSQVTLSEVPPGTYDLYIYGHELDPVSYGDYTLTVGNRSYGRKTTSNQSDAIQNTKFVEGSQYVKFARIEIARGEPIDIFIRPGGNFAIGNAGNEIQSTPAGQPISAPVISDTVICGLQLIPVQ